jgi:hypothetical protein
MPAVWIRQPERIARRSSGRNAGGFEPGKRDVIHSKGAPVRAGAAVFYWVKVTAIHIPRRPPAPLPSREVIDIESAPSRVGRYPPTKEPTTIPIMIIVLRDMGAM